MTLTPDSPSGLIDGEWWRRTVPDKGVLYVKLSNAFGAEPGSVVGSYHPYVPDAEATYERTFTSLARARQLLAARGFSRVDRL